jgi:DNA-3-methyladenine glycosylase I
VPAVTEIAVTISKDLKKRGFTFVGPTIIYAHMQATGMVNDHLTTCFRHKELK